MMFRVNFLHQYMVFLLVIYVFFCISSSCAETTSNQTACDAKTSRTSYNYDVIPCQNNPFRGFMAYTGERQSDFPKSLEYSYVGVDEVMKENDEYDWSVIDTLLSESSSRGNHAVFRLFLDYPDNRNALPSFIDAEKTAYSEHGGGFSPDYNNEQLLVKLEELIAKVAERYDNDQRLGAVQIGLIGMWGEWHTWPHEELMPSRANQERILSAFSKYFIITNVMVSADELDQWIDTDTTTSGTKPTTDFHIGYHDDNFCVGTYHAEKNEDWFFLPKLIRGKAEERYKKVLIGGEVQPDIQNELFLSSWNGQDFALAVANTHCSQLLNDRVFQSSVSSEFDKNARDASLLLGYHFYVSQVDVLHTSADQMSVRVSVENRGSAPIYYEAYIVVNENGERVGADLRLLMPNTPIVLESGTFTLPNSSSMTLSVSCERALPSRPIAFAVQGTTDATKLEVSLDGDTGEDFADNTAQSVCGS